MAVILRRLYEEIKDTEEIKIVAGEAGLDHAVRWVHMVEGMDISSFLEGDEVTFTTGIALKSQEELFSLVKLIYKQKAAGVVINVGPYIEEIGQDIIEFGNEHDFPVFQVPWRVHMANIMRYFTTCINIDGQKEMELVSALKNSVLFPQNTEMYVPALLNLGYKRKWLYEVVMLDFQKKLGILIDKTERNKILKLIDVELHLKNLDGKIVEIEEKLVLFFSNTPEEKIRFFLQKTFEKISKYLILDGKMYVGMGNPVSSIELIGKCYQQAEQVLILQKKRNAKNEIVLYSELGLYRLLLGMENTDLLMEYYKEHLGKLEKYDHMNETDYYYFLKQYFSMGCNVQEVANTMHMHRNSVTYKIHKIEEITGFMLSEQENRTRFMVAFMIGELK